MELDDDTLAVGETLRNFRIFALEADLKTRSLKVRLEVRTLADTSMASTDPNVVEFWVDFFDFPVIDNIRLSHDQRCAVVLNDFEDESADISILEFPGSRAGLKEKPYFDEILHSLREHSAE
jgi:hypothetical protein